MVGLVRSPTAPEVIQMSITFANASKTEAISTAQIDRIKRTLAEIADIQPGKATELRKILNQQYLARTLTRFQASQWVGVVDDIRDELRRRQRAAEAELRDMETGVSSQRVAEPRPEVPVGRYAVENEKGILAFYRVTTDDRGFYRVFVYASDRQHMIKGWTAQKAILRKIETAGIEAAGMRFATEREECRDCGRALTDPESRARGRGEICAGLRAR
jgi:hypothetical protein